MAERALRELQATVSTSITPATTQINLTVVGHSLGGLIARYLIKLIAELLSPPSAKSIALALKSNGGLVVFHQFITLASPHLGSRLPTAGWRMLLRPMLHAALTFGAIGQTGKELLYQDTTSAVGLLSRPLLHQMGTPGKCRDFDLAAIHQCSSQLICPVARE
jgi:pimeloyl-ACP methyl ester carboxylesterase